MSETSGQNDDGERRDLRRRTRLAAGRFRDNRWMLAAGIAAIFVIAAITELSPGITALIVLGLIAIAFIAPRQRARMRKDRETGEGERSGLEKLTAETLAAAVADPMVIFDANGRVVHANAAAISAFNPLDQGMSLLLKFRAPEMQNLIETIRTVPQGSLAADYIERIPIERVYRVTASSVGRGTGLYVLVFKDQSEARRIDRMRADFIANASHELRTPLASISGFVETLRGPARNDANARDHFLQIMQNQTARMARLIDDLLSLSRLEMKPYLVPGAAVDVGEILQSVIDTLTPLAAETGITIEKNLPKKRLEVAGNRDELFQVFENLLENACKYGQSGEKVIVSAALSKADSSEVDISFRDFGPGIPAEHIPRITERFYRVDVETSRAQKGTGLGLSIVKHILTRHNGRLSIKSALGKGSTFLVHLPLLKNNQPVE
jgi:two-component system phosphate regulon sensor histidine kinase PhoR